MKSKMLEHFQQSAVADERVLIAAEVELRKHLSKLKDGTERLTLLNFLRILRLDNVIQMSIASVQSAGKMIVFYQQIESLVRTFESLATGKKSTIPLNISMFFNAAELRKAVSEHRAEVVRARKRNRRGNPHYKVDVNWNELAERLMAQKCRGEPSTNKPGTAWDWAVTALIGHCIVPGINESFVEEWIARQRSYNQSDARTAELARLDHAKIHEDLLKVIQKPFPKEVKKWFGQINRARSGGTSDGNESTRMPKVKREYKEALNAFKKIEKEYSGRLTEKKFVEKAKEEGISVPAGFWKWLKGSYERQVRGASK